MKKILIFFLIFSSTIFSQTKVKVDLSNPHATIYTHLYFLQDDSYQPSKAAQTIYGYQGKEAEIIAIKLKKILDGKGLKIDFTKIPTNHMYADTSGFKIGYKYVLFPSQMPEIYVEKIGNNWYYSQETANKIDSLYQSVFPWYTEKLQQIIPEIGHYSFLKIELWQFIGLFIIALISLGLFYILHKIVYPILKKLQYWIVHKSNDKINLSLKKLTRPIVLLLLIWLIKSTLPALMLHLEVNTLLFLGLNIMTTVFWIYVFLKLVQVIMSIYADYAESTDGKLDDQLVPIVDNFLTGLVIIGGILKLLTLFGVDPVTVVAGASIGGLALALASQDTVKNLIGTIMIFIDKPFHIGDWIEADIAAGTVEKVGFRSTRVRAFDTSIFQIPNSLLSEMIVNNKGLRAYRRYQTNLGVRYDTPPELIEAFVVGIRKIIEVDPSTRNDAFNVEFTGFGDSSLLILLNVYFTQLDWDSEQASKHKLHMAILKLASDLGVEFAFPSTTLMIEQFPDKQAITMPYNLNKERINKIIDAIK
jgi:MscS family membrane protein